MPSILIFDASEPSLIQISSAEAVWIIDILKIASEDGGQAQLQNFLFTELFGSAGTTKLGIELSGDIKELKQFFGLSKDTKVSLRNYINLNTTFKTLYNESKNSLDFVVGRLFRRTLN